MHKTDRFRRWRIGALAVVGIVAAYGVVVGLVLPPIAKKLITEKAGEKLGRVVVLEELRINPFTLDATARGLRILEADRATPFASFEALDIEGSATSLYRFAPIADAVTLTGLTVSLVRDGEAHYNVSDIVDRLAASSAPPKAKDEATTGFSLSNVRLVNARIDFDDRPRGRKHQVTDIHVAVPFISSLPRHLEQFVQPSFAANVNGSPLRVTGETLPFENSLRTHIALDLDALDLRRYVEYSPVPLPVKIESGKLEATLSVRFTQADRRNPTVDVAGKLALSDLAVSNPAGEPLAKVGLIEADIASYDPIAGVARLSALRVKDASGLGGEALVPAIEVKNIQLDLPRKTAQVELVASRGGVVNLTRNREGAIVLPSIALPPSTPPAWGASVAKLTLEGYRISVADRAVKPAVTHHVEVASLELSELTTADGLKATLAAKLGLDQGGSVDVASTFTLEPLQVNARLDARRIDLVGLRPYIRQFPAVALKSGAAAVKGTLVLRGTGDALQVAYNGGVEIANLGTVDTLDQEDLLNWKALRTSGIDLAWASNGPLVLSVADVVVEKAYSRLVLGADGTLNVQRLRTAPSAEPAAEPAAEPVAEAAAPPPAPRNVRIERVTFVDSRLNFTDHAIKPNYSADVGALQGSVTNLSSDPQSRAVVELKGRYDQAAAVLIAGTVNPLRGDLVVDIAAKAQGIELPKLTAYAQRYAGYGITEGKLTLDVKYQIEHGKLEGRNRILLERLTFGDKVDSPEATKLPVLFAVNLLKDANGEIQLELPISGSLADPQFDIGGVITQVLGSLLKKAVTSPFSLLSAAFGGAGASGSGNADPAAAGGEDLAFIEFDAGRSDIAAAGLKKLDTLAKAMQQRPGLKITMAPRLDADQDLQALREAAFQGQLLATKGANATAIDDAEYPKIVRAAYAAAKFPRPAPVNGVVQEPSVAAMEARLLEQVAVSGEDLQALGAKRAEQVRGYLMGKGQLAGDRVRVAAKALEAAQPVKARASRVDFSLQ
jgi:hypothetical protein